MYLKGDGQAYAEDKGVDEDKAAAWSKSIRNVRSVSEVFG